MKHTNYDRTRGFSLIELAIVLAIIVLIAAILTPLMTSLVTVERSTAGYDELGRIYKAIVGDPSKGSYGYLGDVGAFPTSLLDLVQSTATGWNGPYLNDARVDNSTGTSIIYDIFGAPVEYYYYSSNGPFAQTTSALSPSDQLAIISPGPDRGSTNTAANPNLKASFFPAPPLTAGSYAVQGANGDNVVFPRFTDSSGLINVQYAGTLNLNILNYDYNPGIAAYVPACPGMFSIKVAPVTRPNENWGGTGSSQEPPLYSPGGASFDLIQGVYRVQVLIGTSPNPVVWDEQVSINPGATQSRTLYLPGPDSSITPSYGIAVKNSIGTGISIFSYTTTTSTVTTGFSGGPTNFSIKGCSQVTVRNSTTNAVVDSFVMPLGFNSNKGTTYWKNYDLSPTTYQLTNKGGTYKYVFLYQNGELIGSVSRFGNKKLKLFSNIHSGDEMLVIQDDNTVGSNTTNGGTPQWVPIP